MGFSYLNRVPLITCGSDECEMSQCESSFSEETMELTDKFMIVGENVDLKVHRRHMTRDRQNLDFHLFHSIAVKNRIPVPEELVGVPRKFIDHTQLKLTRFLPNADDEAKLRSEIKILISRDLLPELSWMKNTVIEHIPHQYGNYTCEISEIKNLGVINKNEASTEGIIDILKEQHTMVPITADKKNLLRTFAVGDLLTVERSQNAQLDLQDGDSPVGRLEGLIPALVDFHSYGNFMQVIWHMFYSTRSSAEIGTLYQARNFLNARSVPLKPMNDVNACKELLLKYSDALMLAAFMQLEKDGEVSTADPGDVNIRKEATDNILSKFVDQYVLPKMPDLSKKAFVTCPICKKAIKNLKTLQKHINGQDRQELLSNKSDDYVALATSYVFKNFLDARKHGDGERVLRLYKHLLLYCKTDHRVKYSYQTLHLLCQVEFLLPPAMARELTWNRFVNNKGKIDSNIELDRELEHRNKYVKAQLESFQGKITDTAIERVNHSYDVVHEIVENLIVTLLLSSHPVGTRKLIGNKTY